MSIAIHSKNDCLKEFCRVHNSYIAPNLNLKTFLDQFNENQLHVAFDQLVTEKALEKHGDDYFIVEPK